MRINKQQLRVSVRHTLADWLVPPGFQRVLKGARRSVRPTAPRPELQNIAELRGRHKGGRCFVLAGGPSISQQDLTPLEDEVCISTSNFFVHKDYALINPLYHCVPNFCSPPFPESAAVSWFTEMHRALGHATLITDRGNRQKIENHQLFCDRVVRYVDTEGAWTDSLPPDALDLTQPIPPVQSVPVLALMIALYLGFDKIYLLGCDHSWLDHYGDSRHFYPETQVAWVAWGGEAWGSYGEELRCIHELWTEYRHLRAYAERSGRQIYNATLGGRLDVFERVSFQDVLPSKG
jgi:hypothetical protein